MRSGSSNPATSRCTERCGCSDPPENSASTFPAAARRMADRPTACCAGSVAQRLIRAAGLRAGHLASAALRHRTVRAAGVDRRRRRQRKSGCRFQDARRRRCLLQVAATPFVACTVGHGRPGGRDTGLVRHRLGGGDPARKRLWLWRCTFDLESQSHRLKRRGRRESRKHSTRAGSFATVPGARRHHALQSRGRRPGRRFEQRRRCQAATRARKSDGSCDATRSRNNSARSGWLRCAISPAQRSIQAPRLWASLTSRAASRSA